jgi:hypothetical protein
VATKFAIISQEPDTPVADRITLMLKNDGSVGWWHWWSGTWVFFDTKNRDVVWWRERIIAVAPLLKFVILRTSDALDQWAGVGTDEEFEWFHSAWSQPEPEPASKLARRHPWLMDKPKKPPETK